MRVQPVTHVASFTIDGRAFTGDSIQITDGGRVLIDGVLQEGTLLGRIEIHVMDGVIEKLEVNGDVHCGAVGGDLDVKGNVTCSDVSGDVEARGNVACGNIRGDVDAGGNVVCGAVDGDVRAGGGVTCGDVRGDVGAGGGVTINRRS
jgi:hypothetical protein